jgi:radical SAM protein with 4Fe4S-binding SPASM domain
LEAVVNYDLEELSIELSNRCLARCIHCSSGSTPKAFSDELDRDEITDLIIDARQLGASVLSLSGGDPILLEEDVLHYVEKALALGYERILIYTTGLRLIGKERCPYDHVGISELFMQELYNTHGLYNPSAGPGEMWHRVASDHVTFIFSMHSHKPHVNDYIFGRAGVTDLVIDNIRLAKAYGFNVEVHCVPMLPNFKDIIGLREFLSTLGVSKMSLLRFVPQTRGQDNNRLLALDTHDFSGLQETINMLMQDDAHPIIRAGCPMDFRHTMYPDIHRKVHPCHAGKDLILVRPRGDVHPCAAWKSLPETDNVRHAPLKQIWEQGEVFQMLRQYHEDGWKKIQGQCASCRYQRSCKSGCPAQRFHALKLAGLRPDGLTIRDLYVDAPDPLCPLNGVRRYW